MLLGMALVARAGPQAELAKLLCLRCLSLELLWCWDVLPAEGEGGFVQVDYKDAESAVPGACCGGGLE